MFIYKNMTRDLTDPNVATYHLSAGQDEMIDLLTAYNGDLVYRAFTAHEQGDPGYSEYLLQQAEDMKEMLDEIKASGARLQAGIGL